MKLLYVTESVPNRDPQLGDGSSMIPYEVILHLPADVAVTLLTFSGPVPVPAELRARCETVHELAPRDDPAAFVRSFGGLAGLGKHRRSTPSARAAAATLSGSSEATLIHGPHALFLSHHVAGPVVLQTVDPWSIRAAMDTDIARSLRPAYRLREHLAERAERSLPARARLLTVGAQDAAAWSAKLGRSVKSIPNGTSVAAGPRPDRKAPVVCFAGSLNYAPNVDSATVLATRIAPLVWREVPEARFVIAGRQPTAAVQALAGPHIEILANVPSLPDVFNGADVAVFPDEHGVGIRNSVLEALAAGLPVVASPVAARELPPHPLLTVEAGQDAMVRKVVEHLRAPRPPHVTPGGLLDQAAGAVRSWDTVAAEYLVEVRAAVAASSPAGDLSGTSRQL
ncbi:glycosyltransferase [Pseudarthrobacter sp. AG30]|uniref:glycosyltransferase n=1 Tax=Pseudarthrobacter sp. AG30 TaxID=2249742 RepID=UPI000D6417C3|nr:glycosyltransferase [Pseudarthrobacter sp. AG30]RAX17569.1 glycosyltransferase [Pseudarthrobacter sp. AG30]